jgi:HSP20 family protein
MALVSFQGRNPLDGLLQLQAGLERLLRNPSLGLNLGPSGADVFPPVNLFVDRDGGLVVRAEVPGVKPDEIALTVEPRRLTIAGERARRVDEKGSDHRRERRFGRFSRTVQIPEELDPATATAEVRHGVLTVRVAKRADARARQIKVQGS